MIDPEIERRNTVAALNARITALEKALREIVECARLHPQSASRCESIARAALLEGE